MKPNLSRFIVLSLVVIVIIAAIFFVKKDTQIDWESPEDIFSIEIPEGFEEHKIERLNEKIESAKAAYEKNEDDSWAWVEIGSIYEFVRDYDRAIYAYKRSLILQQYDITSTLNLATIYSEYRVDLEQAEVYYKKAIEIHTNNPGMYDMLAKFYIQKQKNNDKGEATYLLGLQKTNNHPDLLVSLVKFYRDTGDTEKEEVFAKQTLELYPDINTAFRAQYEYLVE